MHRPIAFRAEFRWHVMHRIAGQEIRDALLGWAVWLTASAGLLLAAVLIYNSLRFVAAGSGLEILDRPFHGPALAASMLALLFVAVGATLAIARPREQGALRVLFAAPVDAVGLVGAHFIAGFGLYVLLVLLLAPAFALLSVMTNIYLPPVLLGGLALSTVAAAPAVAIGLLISALAPSSRAATLLLVATVAVAFLIQGGYAALLSVPPTSQYYDPLLFLRVVLRTVNEVLLWVSPISILGNSLDAALRSDTRTMLSIAGWALGSSGLWLVAAVRALRWRGVVR